MSANAQGKGNLLTSVRIKTALLQDLPGAGSASCGERKAASLNRRGPPPCFTLLLSSNPALCQPSSPFLHPKQNHRRQNRVRKLGQLDSGSKGNPVQSPQIKEDAFQIVFVFLILDSPPTNSAHLKWKNSQALSLCKSWNKRDVPWKKGIPVKESNLEMVLQE